MPRTAWGRGGATQQLGGGLGDEWGAQDGPFPRHNGDKALELEGASRNERASAKRSRA